MEISILISYIIISAVSIVCLGFAGIFIKKNNKEEFSFVSFFPYELFEVSGKQNIILRAIHIVSLLSPLAMASYLIAYLSMGSITYNTFSILLAFALTFSSISYLLITIIKPKYYKTFIFLFLLLAGSISIECVVFALLISKHGAMVANPDMAFAFSMILYVLSVLNLVFLFNPKLKNWDKLEKEEDEQGTIHYLRPKVLFLALHEWILIVYKTVIEILAFIFIFLL